MFHQGGKKRKRNRALTLLITFVVLLTQLGSLILAQTAHTTSKINKFKYGGKTFPAAANFELLNHSFGLARKKKHDVFVGPVVSIETRDEINVALKFAQRGAYALDLEMNQVYTVANRNNVPVVGMLSVFENLLTHEQMDHQNRKEHYLNLVKLALEVAKAVTYN